MSEKSETGNQIRVHLEPMFYVAQEEESHGKDLESSLLLIAIKQHAMFIGCQHQRCPCYCLKAGAGVTLSSGKAPYPLQRILFVTSGFQSLLCC